MPMGAPELLVILLVFLLLFGAKQLPKFAKAVAESIKELRQAVDHDGD